VEARLAEARRREASVRRLEAELEGGASFEAAVRRLDGVPSSPTLRRWLVRWRLHGLAGLVETRIGPVSSAKGAVPRAAPVSPQLLLAMPGGTKRAAPSPRPRSSRGNPPGLLKWPGSKLPIAGRLVSLAPGVFGRYHEPFVGSGALFFALRPERAFLGDRNAELVNLYRVVRDEPEALLDALRAHRGTREHYHAVRGLHPDALPPVERAARTLFLNRTCFNGLYRVNRHGLFNVPYGRQENTTFFQPSAIRDAHRALRGAEILVEDFEACAERARSGDLVYLDPPYPAGPGGDTSFDYQPDGFGEEEQGRVAALFRTLDRRGCLVMASNADTPLTRRLYQGFEIVGFSVRRAIGGHPTRRGRAAEIVVRNYTGRRDSLPGL
jgi:DNA adenine methylase